MHRFGPWRQSIALSAAIIAGLCLVSHDVQAQPQQVKAEAEPLSERTRAAHIRDYMHRQFVQSYLDGPWRNPDPEIDADAITLLTDMADHMSNIYTVDIYDQHDFVRLGDEKGLAIARRLVAAKCEDPVVAYTVGRWLLVHKLWEEALPAYDFFIPAVRKNAPGSLMHMWILRWRAVQLEHFDRLDEAAQLRQERHDLAPQLARGPFADPLDRLLVFEILWDNYFSSETPAVRESFVNAVEADPQADPWLASMFRGEHEVALAWEARGTGFADTVTEAGWKGMREHLGKARRALRRAYKIEPGYAESTTRLITVAMGGATAGSESPKYWFDRAHRAQPDHYPAWENYLYALLPRWGGSFEQMLELGVRALMTNRFDTRIPDIYYHVIVMIGDDLQDRSVWKIPGVHQGLDHYFQGVLNDPTRQPHHAYTTNLYAATAYLGDRHKLFLELCDQLGGHYIIEPWQGFNIDPDYAQGDAKARLNP